MFHLFSQRDPARRTISSSQSVCGLPRFLLHIGLIQVPIYSRYIYLVLFLVNNVDFCIYYSLGARLVDVQDCAVRAGTVGRCVSLQPGRSLTWQVRRASITLALVLNFFWLAVRELDALLFSISKTMQWW